MKIPVLINSENQLFWTTSRNEKGQIRVMAWTSSKAKALRLFVEKYGKYCSTNEMRERMAVSGNEQDIAKCSKEPDKIFTSPL